MCLGIPAKVIEVNRFGDLGIVEGKVDFAGVKKQINLSFTPEVEVGEYVVVHVGFSISVVDEQEAQQVFAYLEEMDELAELDIPQPE